jgi:hypothetical protein
VILKGALLLLALVLAFGLAGKLLGGGGARAGKPRPPIEVARKCPRCDAYVLGSEAGSCGRPDCPQDRGAA